MAHKDSVAKPAWSAVVVTLFPEMFPGPLGHSWPGGRWKTGFGRWKRWTFVSLRAINTAPSTTLPLAAALGW